MASSSLKFIALVGCFGGLASCDEEDRPHEYRAGLAEEASRLVLHVADDQPNEFLVWLDGDFTPTTGCPRFEVSAAINGTALALEDGYSGGLAHAQDSDHKVTSICVLPRFVGSYDGSSTGKGQLAIEVKDGSGQLRAVVRAPDAEPPRFERVESGPVVAGSVQEFKATPALTSPSILPSLRDADGSSHSLPVVNFAGDRVSLQMPNALPSGTANVTVFVRNWSAAPVLEACEGPKACELLLGASVGDYHARSRATSELEIVQGP